MKESRVKEKAMETKENLKKGAKRSRKMLIWCCIILFVLLACQKILSPIMGAGLWRFLLIADIVLTVLAVGGECLGKGPIQWVIDLIARPEEEEESAVPAKEEAKPKVRVVYSDDDEPEEDVIFAEAEVPDVVFEEEPSQIFDDLEVPIGDWELRRGKFSPKMHLSELIASGKVHLPDEYILEGKRVRYKAMHELIREGTVSIPLYCKLSDDGDRIVLKTLEELYKEKRSIPPLCNFVNNSLVLKTLRELVDEGKTIVPPGCKLSDGGNSIIVDRKK